MNPIRSISVRILAACAVILALAIPSFAQQPVSIAKATVPFEFQVHGRVMEPGAYKFSSTPGGAFLTVTNPAGAQQLYLGVPVGNPLGQYEPKLVFEKIGGQYHLTEVWFTSGGASRAIPLSKAARELARREKSEKTQIALTR